MLLIELMAIWQAPGIFSISTRASSEMRGVEGWSVYIDGLSVAFWRVMRIVLGSWIQVD